MELGHNDSKSIVAELLEMGEHAGFEKHLKRSLISFIETGGRVRKKQLSRRTNLGTGESNIEEIKLK